MSPYTHGVSEAVNEHLLARCEALEIEVASLRKTKLYTDHVIAMLSQISNRLDRLESSMTEVLHRVEARDIVPETYIQITKSTNQTAKNPF